MQVDDTVEQLGPVDLAGHVGVVLQFDPVLDSTEVIPKVRNTRRLYTAEDTAGVAQHSSLFARTVELEGLSREWSYCGTEELVVAKQPLQPFNFRQ
jgi:hypothetical protein